MSKEPTQSTTEKTKLTAADKKAAIRAMAANGDKRPSQKTVYGNALANYVNPKNGSYDAELHDHLRSTRADWFRAPKASTEA